MLHYLLDYGAYILGIILYVLGKVQDYKAMAKANPDPKVVYDTRHFLNDEWVNFARMLVGGIALVLFMPILIGGATVDFKNADGAVIANLEIKTLLAPFYFLVGYSGTSGLFAVLGKYKKTLFNGVGVSENQNP